MTDVDRNGCVVSMQLNAICISFAVVYIAELQWFLENCIHI